MNYSIIIILVVVIVLLALYYMYTQLNTVKKLFLPTFDEFKSVEPKIKLLEKKTDELAILIKNKI